MAAGRQPMQTETGDRHEDTIRPQRSDRGGNDFLAHRARKIRPGEGGYDAVTSLEAMRASVRFHPAGAVAHHGL